MTFRVAYAAILECLWVRAIGVQDSAEVDEPCTSEYASASQFFPLLAGEEIYGRISATEFWKTWLVCDHVFLNCYFLIQQFVAIEIHRRRGLTVLCAHDSKHYS